MVNNVHQVHHVHYPLREGVVNSQVHEVHQG